MDEIREEYVCREMACGCAAAFMQTQHSAQPGTSKTGTWRSSPGLQSRIGEWKDKGSRGWSKANRKASICRCRLCYLQELMAFDGSVKPGKQPGCSLQFTPFISSITFSFHVSIRCRHFDFDTN